MSRPQIGSGPAGAADALWFRLPRRLSRFAATLAAFTGDGSYLARYRVVGYLAHPAALAAGVLLGASHPGDTYTRSEAVMMALLAIGAASAALGLSALVGYAFGDFFLHDRAPVFTAPGDNAFVQQRVPLLITYVVLGFALALAPASAAALRGWVRSLRVAPGLAALGAIGAGAGVVGFLVYSWAKVTAVLVRPVFTWRGFQPSVPDIAPLQENTWWLVAVAVAVTLVRTLVEEQARARRVVDPREQQLAIFIALRIQAVNATVVRRTVVSVATGTTLAVVLSGMIVGIGQGLLVAAFLVAVLLVRDALARSRLPAVAAVQRVPVLVRVAGAFVVGRLVSENILTRAWDSSFVAPTDTFEPLLASVCLWAALMTIAGVQGTPPEVAMFERDIARSRR